METIKLIPQNLTENASYLIPNTALAKLEFNPIFLRFRNPPIGTAVNQDITVTARNSTFTVTDIKVSNQLFDISPKSFTLQANESRILTISYIAKDSGYTFTKFSFEADNQCNKDLYASARFGKKKPLVPTLKVTNPNGGEMFAVGSDTVITWEGIPADELVRLEYSIDNGTTWKYIDTARGLSYRWDKVPKPTSNQCLVRVSQIEEINGICWSKTCGGSVADEAKSIIEDSDGNYVVAGWAYSSDGDVHGSRGNTDYWILKISPQTGDTIWTKTYGGSNTDHAYSLIEDSDGNYVVAGKTYSSDGDVHGNKGDGDYWILKISPQTGDTIWTKIYGGSNTDYAYSIIEDSDGNYVVAGQTLSTDGDVKDNKGYDDYWILKINPQTGDTIWSETYGGSNSDRACSIIEDRDGNYIIVGESSSRNYDVPGNKGMHDYWILKISEPKELQSDVSDSQFSILAPALNTKEIDMKQCLVSGVKDSLVTNFIHNTGTLKCRVDSIYFTGTDKDVFSLVSGLPVYTVDAGKDKATEFRFKPKRVGLHTAQIVIITQADTLIQNIFGEGVQPMPEVINNLIDFGKVNLKLEINGNIFNN